ncbi:unnamed protein product [Linum tenue]|uniref:Transposase n=1 Tax=Linum tenue TaxID=586396 RepID=A0AAV0K2Q4_9ROSI|nr:unnamed protein product [Linum tenue]
MCRMEDPIELILCHGGYMDMTGAVPKYVGGDEAVVNMVVDVLSYFELTKTLIEDLEYVSVERLWYLTPGKSMATGLHEIHSDAEVMNGLLPCVAKGQVRVYFEATKDLVDDGFMGDNYGHEHDGSDEDGENSAVPEFVRVGEEDDAQTSDEEYHEIRQKVRNRRQKYRAQIQDSGEEVDQVVLEEDEGSEGSEGCENGGQNEPGSEEQNVGSGNGGQNVGDQAGEDDANSGGSMETEYRGSEYSAHVRGNIGEQDNVTKFDKSLLYDPKCDHKALKFVPCMRFKSPEQFKAAVMRQSIVIGADIRWVRSSDFRKEAVCAQRKEFKCGWRVYASWFRKNETFMVKGVGTAHSCPRSLHIRAAGQRWIAEEFIETFRANQGWDVGLIAAEIKRKYNLVVTNQTCYRARLEARRMLYGSLEEDFAQIRSYIGHLLKVDPQGSFLLEVDVDPGCDKVFFKRLYISFSSLSKGFLAGCRPFFCLDGCFLKGEVQGMLLAAVGKDGNNHMFPIAWAIVESENKSSWIWFINALQNQLGTEDGSGFTIVSDQQKVTTLLIMTI